MISSANHLEGATILFVGAGRHQRRALVRMKELGVRLVAVDRNPDAPGLRIADHAELVDVLDLSAVVEVGRRHGVDGVMTYAADRAVPVVAAVAEALGLPGIGTDTAHLMTNKIAMRRQLADAGVPQPRYAAVRTLQEARAAASAVGFPAVLKPADNAGQRGLFLCESRDDVERYLHASLAQSTEQEAILESYHEGTEVNGLLVVRDGEPAVVTLSDRRRPPGRGFGVAIAHVYPSTLFGDALEEVRRTGVHTIKALGLRNGIAYPQVLWSEDGVARLVEVAARIPAGQMDSVARYGVGVDLIEIALLQALGRPVPDELVAPKTEQPMAISFLTAEPGPLPTGRLVRVSGLERVQAFPGVVEAELYFQEGETIRPVQLDGDRRGYVIALGRTNLEAVERAESAARLLDVEVEAA
ncbi:MAG TPA: ATP-grasp domain-containing protein [Gaiellaceae bacterium]|nr:ATP-grasp domain-containing protein [Gaiellaceae bacterium]